MLTTRKVDRVSIDDPVTAEDRNYLAEQIELREPINGPGLNIERTGYGVILSAIPYQGLIRVDIPSGGIAAATSNGATPPTITCGFTDCNVGVFSNGVWSPVTGQRRVYNDLMVTVTGPKIGYAIPSEDGSLHLIVLPC